MRVLQNRRAQDGFAPMIPYHGTPVSGSGIDAARFLAGRHALVPYEYQSQLAVVLDVCKSVIFDNSAFTKWKQGGELDVPGFTRWCEKHRLHPRFRWGLIPDVIDGDERDNDALLRDWPLHIPGVPVYHLHEDLGRLDRLVSEWETVALGSSGEWPTPGAGKWWQRMADVMRVACDSAGRPRCRLHGLRMLSPAVFTKLPLSSADSVNAGLNSFRTERFGMYVPPTNAQRAAVIADRVEANNSPAVWTPPAALAEMLS